jgi:hypothetical protein
VSGTHDLTASDIDVGISNLIPCEVAWGFVMLHCLGRFACWVATVSLATRRLRLGNGCVDPTAVGLFAMMRAGHAIGTITRLSHHESYGNHRPVCVPDAAN